MKFGVGKLCGRVGMSRQNFYKESRQRKRREVDADLVEQLVKAQRAVQPRLGGRKLHHLCKKSLEEAGAGLGRDRFFDVLADRDLLLEPLPKRPRTTDSRHCLPVFTNRVKGLILERPNQAWAGDITYIRTDEGFLYLSLLTDLYSRKIVGFHAGDDGGLRASCQDDIFGFDLFLPASLKFDFNVPRTSQSGCSLDNFDVIFLHQKGDALGESLACLAAALEGC